MLLVSHVAAAEVLPTLMRGGTVHLVKGFDPEAVLKTIARKRIKFALFVPTIIYPPPSDRELIDLVERRKGCAHAPERNEFVAQLPLTGVGKIDKEKLRGELWAGRGRMVG